MNPFPPRAFTPDEMATFVDAVLGQAGPILAEEDPDYGQRIVALASHGRLGAAFVLAALLHAEATGYGDDFAGHASRWVAGRIEASESAAAG